MMLLHPISAAVVNYHINLSCFINMIDIWIYLTIYLTQTNNTSPCPDVKPSIQPIHVSQTIFEGLLLQVTRAYYINQVLTWPVCKFHHFFI